MSNIPVNGRDAELCAELRERAGLARGEGTETARTDARYFEEAADRIVALGADQRSGSADTMVNLLVWIESRRDDKWERFSAFSVIGRYEAIEWSDGEFGWSFTPHDADDETGVAGGDAISTEAAKAAAQAHLGARGRLCRSHVMECANCVTGMNLDEAITWLSGVRERAASALGKRIDAARERRLDEVCNRAAASEGKGQHQFETLAEYARTDTASSAADYLVTRGPLSVSWNHRRLLAFEYSSPHQGSDQ